MNTFRQFILPILIFIQLPIIAQVDNKTAPLPIFSPFEGTVYEMPKFKHTFGKLTRFGIQEYYSDTIYSYPVIGQISLDKLNISETYTKDGGFPGVEPRVKFAMVLHSKMKVQVDACYEFSLNSDDGSRLWINEIQIVGNDGGHGMRMKKDTVGLLAGEYDAKVWYFQSYPDRFGLEMESKIIGKISKCAHHSLDSKKPFKKIVFDNVYFDTDKYTLKREGLIEIEKIAKIIDETRCRTIRVVGHTDSQGTEQYNKMLSLNRSDAVALALQELISDQEIEFIILGRGQSEPLEENDTSKGREKNRRVEIFLIE